MKRRVHKRLVQFRSSKSRAKQLNIDPSVLKRLGEFVIDDFLLRAETVVVNQLALE